MKDIRKYLAEPGLPWKRGPYIGGAGLFACGWTEDNRVFLLFPDYYVICNPLTGQREIMIEDDETLSYLSKDNLEYDLKELNQKIKVFGLRGGNGNHFTTDRWSITEISTDSQEKIFGMTDYRNFGRRENIFWKNYNLIVLKNLEFGQWCGFSPNEKSFGIFGSGGVELFNRE